MYMPLFQSSKRIFFTQFKIDTTKNLIGFELSIDLPPKLGHERFLAPTDPSGGVVSQGLDSSSVVSVPPIP